MHRSRSIGCWIGWLWLAGCAGTPQTTAPTAPRIYDACMRVEAPKAVARYRAEGRAEAEAREGGVFFAHLICRVSSNACAQDPTDGNCPAILAEYGLGKGVAASSGRPAVDTAADVPDAPDGAPAAAAGTAGVAPDRDDPPRVDDALFDAAYRGHTAVLEDMIARGVPLNRQGAGGWTPLMIAAAEGRTEAVTLLLAGGADPRLRNRLGRTALMFAAAHGDLDIVGPLLDAGAEVDVVPTDDSGWTALMAAAAHGHGAVVERLLQAGADPRRRARDGQTALDLARAGRHHAAIDVLERAGR